MNSTGWSGIFSIAFIGETESENLAFFTPGNHAKRMDAGHAMTAGLNSSFGMQAALEGPVNDRIGMESEKSIRAQ